MLRIVFPDADSNMKSLLTEDLIMKLESVAEFEIYDERPKTDEEFIRRVQYADALLLGWGISNEVIRACENLKMISFTGYGVRNFIDLEYTRKKGIIVTNTPAYGDNAVAEHALALMMALTKNIPENDRKIRKGNWDQSTSNMELKGKTIGLVGIGGIGKRMAELCNAMGMEVISWTFNPSVERGKELGVMFVELEELLDDSDIVSLHLPYTNNTQGIIGKPELEAMKPGCMLINTARAELVDTAALIQQLERGHLAGAGIDVFDQEPIHPDSPLLKMDNVILSPHVGYNTPESVSNIIKIAVDNVVQGLKGDPVNVVND
ncbi:2-hydroxyacid dehydrogenase [Oceanobacillus luteolus]|uniref:2-hydroxyacid dehydrogenase n=1 Tax=Oceanobacillus luteolus TaxID=1274358 RepID=A0ABW4HQ73_9BACI